MNKQKNIRKGGLSDKMSGFSKEPPVSVWEGVSSEIGSKRSGRRLIFIFATAASIALAATVSLTLIFRTPEPNLLSDQQNQVAEESGQITQKSKENTVNSDENPVLKEEQVAEIAKARSNLEERVLTAIEEVMQEEKDAELKLAVLADEESEEKDESMNETEVLENQEDENVPDAEGFNPEEGENLEDIIEESDVNVSANETVTKDEHLVVNEDSLLQLLQSPVDVIEPEIEDSGPGKWSLGAIVSPLLSYRDAAAADKALNTAVNSSESAKITYSGGVRFAYHQSERLSFESGIYYSKMGVNIGDYKSFSGISNWFSGPDDKIDAPTEASDQSIISISNSMGTIVSEETGLFLNTYSSGSSEVADYGELRNEEIIMNSAVVDGFSQSFEYLEIPFNVKYTILDKQLDIQLIGGFSTNLLINNSLSAYNNGYESSIGEMQDVRSVNYAGNAGLGLVYSIAKNFNLSVEPRFRYYLHSINLDVLPTTRPYSFGLYTGINYTF